MTKRSSNNAELTTYAKHAPGKLRGSVVCIECHKSWPCDPVRVALPKLVHDPAFRI